MKALRSVRRRILIKLEGDVEVFDHLKTKSGVKIYLTEKYGADERTNTNGLVVGTNPEMEKLGLKYGTRVFFSRFVVGAYDKNAQFASNSFIHEGVKLYDVDITGNIYAILGDDGIESFSNYCLLKVTEIPNIETTTSGIIFSASGYFNEGTTKLKHTARLEYLSKRMVELGYKKGDVVSFRKDHDTPIDILGESYIAVEDRDITCQVHEGELQRSKA
jgi:co-chaperonin GroES (HSP10)